VTTWIDSHCHLQERYVAGEDEAGALAALEHAATVGVAGVVCVGTDEATSRQAVDLARRTAGMEGVPAVRAVVGVHPHEGAPDLAWLSALLAEGAPEVVGVGECGLDYHYDNAPRAEQRRSFAAQLHLAQEHDLAVVIHARDAWEDLFDVLGTEGMPRATVLHCFTGGPAEAARLLEIGATISFSGIVTFKNAQEVRDAAALVPATSLLVETDSPFLAPVPHRGQPNEPAMVGVVGRALSEARGESEDDTAAATSANAARIFHF
jgi:TatD DNase family protein